MASARNSSKPWLLTAAIVVTLTSATLTMVTPGVTTL